jgi:hypothetical protein
MTACKREPDDENTELYFKGDTCLRTGDAGLWQNRMVTAVTMIIAGR